MPTGSERLIWGFGDGSTMPVFDTPLGKVGAVICWENYMPLLRAAQYAKGVQLYCAPTADGRDTWLATVRHIAVEGRCFVLSCNQFARRGDYPRRVRIRTGGRPGRRWLRAAAAASSSPLGEVLAGPDFEGETVLTADIDLADIARGKVRLRRRRPLRAAGCLPALVNEKPASPVVFEKE